LDLPFDLVDELVFLLLGLVLHLDCDLTVLGLPKGLVDLAELAFAQLVLLETEFEVAQPEVFEHDVKGAFVPVALEH